MKLFTLRDVVLALLFALLTDAVYAGSSGPTPGQRENRRDQHNNGGQGQQGGGQFGQGRGGQIPQGGVQVLPALPPQDGGRNRDQFNRHPGNQQNRNEADADTRNNPVAGPAIPTDGNPAARPVPPTGPTAGTTTVPAAQPHQQGNVRQRGQQLGLDQKLRAGPQGQLHPPQPQAAPIAGTTNGPAAQPHQQGNVQQQQREGGPPRGVPAGNGAPPVVNPRNPGGPVVLGDVNEAGEGGLPRGMPAGNGAPPVVSPRNPGGPVVLGDVNAAGEGGLPRGVPAGNGAPPVITPRQLPLAEPQPLAEKINSEPNALRVYDRPRVVKPTISPSAHLIYEGELIFSGQVPRLDSEGFLQFPNKPGESPKGIGTLIGGGANSKVYTSSDAGVIKKFVYLGSSDADPNRRRGLNTLYEQDTSRAILGDIKQLMADVPFQVVQRVEDLLWVKARDQNKKEHWFALSREQNISGEEQVTAQGHGALNNLAGVTNALDRLQVRAPDRRGETTSLAEREEFTVNLVIRTLNQHGVVWTDHKLANFDIVPDGTSFTGFKVVFFDLDGFRPVKGVNRDERERTARELQVIHDSSVDSTDLTGKLHAFAQRHGLNGGYTKAFDNTVYGKDIGCCITTPGANENRDTYKTYNALNDEVFSKIVSSMKADPKS